MESTRLLCYNTGTSALTGRQEDTDMKQFGFIGMGNMGYAILNGLLKSKTPDQIIFSARNKEHMEQVAAETGVSYAADNITCAKAPVWCWQ